MVSIKKMSVSLLLGAVLLLSGFAVYLHKGTSESVYAAEKEVLFTKDDLTWNMNVFGNSTQQPGSNIATNSNGFAEAGTAAELIAKDSVTLKSINGKGKFTTGGYDGITFLNTVIKAADHDFYLEATVDVVAYGTSNGDGTYTIGNQDGFALMVRDSIGSGSTDGMYSNSFSAIATKITYRNASGGNVDIYGGIGARYVEGIRDGSTAPEAGTFNTTYNEFDKEYIARTGEQVKFSIEKKNNSYTATYYKNELSTISYTMYATRDTNEDKLMHVDKENLYVGFSVARDCIATFRDITMNVYDRHTEKIEIPDEIIASRQVLNPLTTVTSSDYDFSYVSNQPGTLKILVNEQEVAANIAITQDVPYARKITLPSKINTIDAVLTPDADWTPGIGMKMSTYAVISKRISVEVDKYGKDGETVITAPNGSPNGDGTMLKPLSLKRAIEFLQPGQTIVMLEGTYNVTTGLMIERNNNGTADKMKRLVADPDATTRPVINFSSNLGFVLKGDFWHLKGFDITNTKDKEKGLTVWGHNNVIELLDVYRCGNTGIQISGSSEEPKSMWPTNNLVLNCTAYHNYDATFADADGFAAKLTCGEGNVFNGCVAYENADDGFDLYAKPETGVIGKVVIKNSLAYENGHVPLPGVENMRGNGNGFKMGGSNMPGPHEIYNSISFNNDKKGIESNSGTNIKINNCTSYNNGSENYSLYTSASDTGYVIDGAVSFHPQGANKSENFVLKGVQSGKMDTDIKKSSNYFWEGGKSVNKGGYEFTAAMFDSLEFKGFTRSFDGTIVLTGGFLTLNDSAPSNAGGRIQRTPGEDFVIGKVVDARPAETEPPAPTLPKANCSSFALTAESSVAVAFIGASLAALAIAKKRKTNKI